MTRLYGIKNCDTVRKARKWLTEHSVDFEFQDFREQALTAEKVSTWLNTLGAKALINTRSTTWKQLNESQQSLLQASPESKAVLTLLIANPTLIKRPVLEHKSTVKCGFNTADYATLFK